MDHPLAWFWHFLWLLPLLHLPPRGAQAFFPNFWSRTMAFTWDSVTHQDMTEEAILNVTLRIFVEMEHPTKGKCIREEDFKGRTLLADDIFAAFYGPEVSAKRFRGAIAQVANANAAMDFTNTTRDDPVLHFDSELIRSTNSWLMQTRKEILQAVRSEQYVIARGKLGQLLHTLQDFYSHSNWIELGHRKIHPHLLQPGHEIKSIAEGFLSCSPPAGVRTCTDCSDWTCRGNLLEGLLEKGLLTTGFYGAQPEKPIGKCSHGGRFDDSRHREPRGGINKDSSSFLFSPHNYLHREAAAVAQEASVHFLEKLWREIKSKLFMRLLDISPATGLSFVVDTTGSMGEEISAAKRQAWEIITSRRGTLQEPDFYLLVPFNDPEFGPVHKTSDPDEFWKILNTISPLKGGDEPEMCLSALQLALQNSPPYSEIFVFTDASAKDAHLKNSVEALIQEQKCKVTFLITEDPSRTRVKRETLSPDRFNLYISLAHSSGGQIIFTDNENIQRVSEIIGESSTSSVTLFRHQKGNIFSPKGSQRRRRKEAAQLEDHTFWIDSLVDKVVLTIQGGVRAFEMQNPAGVRQASSSASGPLAKIQSIGSIYRAVLSPPVHAGKWRLRLQSQGHYSVHVQGQSTFDFLYYFAVPKDGRHPGLFMMDSSPVQGLPTYLVVMATGLKRSPEAGSVQLKAVNLEGTGGSLEELKLEGGANRTDLLVAKLPPTLMTDSSFSVVLRALDGDGQKVERAAPQATTVEASLLELSTDAPVFPGRPVAVAWKVTNPGSPKQYDLRVSSVPGFPVNISSSRLQLDFNQTATGLITLNVPDAADPGSAITLTLQARLLHPSGDPSFAHLQLLVMPLPLVQKPVSSPVCNVTSVGGSCGPPRIPCHDQRWTATLRIWDEAGVRSVHVEGGTVVAHHADGLAESVTYTSDCCSQQARLVVTNLLGQKYRCQVASAPPALTLKPRASSPEVLRKPVAAAGAAASWGWVLMVSMATGWMMCVT
ncbi:von Willebrand factor A domain-containing protein 7 isoform X1 [Podarcis raffonei]|uniref:von Willebrand factor A domain-containing protein 7 isoform X1 n=2 Tax=Podarcis raffonei TaxID=65483 RepID=UPI0023290EEC|nr:von Willebrand factor A domain-containing protein 7 isoform X1 [Podarcis raffonei]XP_053235066.1 von Willebrand factor A domain-containing protein 7 isoform X1 [Podarcis raffonei]XP_053235067.1 von Willebrand factor A domain-containing protein 7 isoform X1 [Podarcis raffonei]